MSPIGDVPATDLIQTGTTTLTFEAGSTTATGTVDFSAVNDEVYSGTRQFRVSTSTSPGGAVTVARPFSFRLTITDDETRPTLSVDLMPSSIDENGGVSSLTASLSGPARFEVTVEVTSVVARPNADGGVTQTGSTLTIQPGSTTATDTVQFTAVDNDVYDRGGKYDIYWTSEGDVQPVGGTLEVLTITNDEEKPTLSFELTPLSISENGGTSSLTASLSAVSFEDVTATVQMSPVGGAPATDLIQTGTTLTFEAGSTTATGTVQFSPKNDEVYSGTRQFKVAVSYSSGGTVTVSGDLIFRLAITDDDTPMFTVTASPASIAEASGQSTVTVSTGGVTFAVDREITLTLTGTAEKGTDYTVGSETLTLSEGATSVETTVTALQDVVDDDDETVVVTAEGASATITIADDDDTASFVVSITGGGAVTEGGDATFTVTASPSPSSVLTVNLTVSQTGSFVAPGDLGSKTVAVPTSGSATYTVATVDDSADEANGAVTATVGTGSGYSVHGTNSSASVTVNDNDDPPAITPVVSITGGGAVIEGGDATFTVTASPSPSSVLTVNLTVSQTGSFVAPGDLGSKTVAVPTSGSATYTVATVDDSADEANGAVTATVGTGSGYSVHGTNSSASVTVNDNDDPPAITPVVSITGGGAVIEGGDATFTVTASPSPSSVLTVNLTVSQTGSFVAPGDLGSKTVAVPTSGSATYTVATVDDSADEANGAVTATVGTGSGYSVHGTNSSASVTVNDNDDPPAITPVVSITGGGAVTEGGDATFTVTASPSPSSVLTVNLTVSQTGSFVAPGDLGSKTVAVPTSGSATYTVATVDDSADEANGAVTATVGTGSGYSVHGTNSSASVTVNDNDDPPSSQRISLETEPKQVREDAGRTMVAVKAVLTNGVRQSNTMVMVMVEEDVEEYLVDPAQFELLIPAGDTNVDGEFMLTPTDDDEAEQNQQVPVRGTNGPDGIPVDETAVMLVDDDGPRPNRPPTFDQSYTFDLEENRSGQRAPVVLGTVRAQDPDGDGIFYSLSAGDRDRFTVSRSNGTVSYIGEGEDYESGPSRFELRISASDGEYQVQTDVVVRVLDVAEAPEAADDGAQTAEDTSKVIDVLSNDRDPDGDPLAIAAVGSAEHGTTTVASDGIRYVPELNWHGADRFTYTVSDPGGLTSTATVTVTVLPVNDPPNIQPELHVRSAGESGWERRAGGPRNDPCARPGRRRDSLFVVCGRPRPLHRLS